MADYHINGSQTVAGTDDTTLTVERGASARFKVFELNSGFTLASPTDNLLSVRLHRFVTADGAGTAQHPPQFVLGEIDLAEPQQGAGHVVSTARPQLGKFVAEPPGTAGLEQFQTSLEDHVGAAEVAGPHLGPTLLAQVDKIVRPRLKGVVFLQVDDVGETLDRNVENGGENAKLVEGRVAAAFFVARQLRVVDFAALFPGALLDPPQGESVSLTELPEVFPQLGASSGRFHPGPPGAIRALTQKLPAGGGPGIAKRMLRKPTNLYLSL